MMHTIETARPFPFLFDPAHTALIVIDMQRDFIEPGGFGEALGNDVAQLAAAIEPCKRLIEACRKAGLFIVHTKEAHKPDLSDCPPSKRNRGHCTLRIGDDGPMGRILVAGEPGTDIIAELAPADGEAVIEKPGKGAFYATGLQAMLQARKIEHLFFGGVTTEVCVQSTMREANDRGYDCLLAEDATDSYYPQFKAAALDMIRAQGAIVGWTATTAEIADVLENQT